MSSKWSYLLLPPPPLLIHTQEYAQRSGDTESAAIVNLAKALEEGSLDQDPFIQQYRAKRLEEMKQHAKLGAQR